MRRVAFKRAVWHVDGLGWDVGRQAQRSRGVGQPKAQAMCITRMVIGHGVVGVGDPKARGSAIVREVPLVNLQ